MPWKNLHHRPHPPKLPSLVTAALLTLQDGRQCLGDGGLCKHPQQRVQLYSGKRPAGVKHVRFSEPLAKTASPHRAPPFWAPPCRSQLPGTIALNLYFNGTVRMVDPNRAPPPSPPLRHSPPHRGPPVRRCVAPHDHGVSHGQCLGGGQQIRAGGAAGLGIQQW